MSTTIAGTCRQRFIVPLLGEWCVHTARHRDTEIKTDTDKLEQNPMGICVWVYLYAI